MRWNEVKKIFSFHFIFYFSFLSCSVFAEEHYPEHPKFLFSLQEAEQIASQSNPQIKATEQLLIRAKEGKLQAFSKWFPELTAISQGFKTQKPQTPIIDSTTSFQTQLTITQALFSTDNYYDVKLSSLYVEQLELLLDAAINDVLFQVRTFYYKLLLDLDNIQTAKEHVELFSSLSEQMQSRYKVGEAILYNVNQSKVAISNALNRYYIAVRDYKTDVERFLDVLGLDPQGQKVELTEKEIPIFSIPELAVKLKREQEIFNPSDIETLIFEGNFPQTEIVRSRHLFSSDEIFSWETAAEQSRPDLQISENGIKISAQEIKKRRGEYYPEVSGVFNYGGESSPFVFNPSTHFNNQIFHWGVGVNLSWTLFDGFGREHRIKEAKAKWRAERFNYQKALQTAHLDVRKQIYSIEQAITSYINAEATVKLAEQTVEQVRQQLEVGYVTIFDYQISVDSLIQARNSRNAARYDVLFSYYGLRHASGVDIHSADQTLEESL